MSGSAVRSTVPVQPSVPVDRDRVREGASVSISAFTKEQISALQDLGLDKRQMSRLATQFVLDGASRSDVDAYIARRQGERAHPFGATTSNLAAAGVFTVAAPTLTALFQRGERLTRTMRIGNAAGLAGGGLAVLGTAALAEQTYRRLQDSGMNSTAAGATTLGGLTAAGLGASLAAHAIARGTTPVMIANAPGHIANVGVPRHIAATMLDMPGNVAFVVAGGAIAGIGAKKAGDAIGGGVTGSAVTAGIGGAAVAGGIALVKANRELGSIRRSTLLPLGMGLAAGGGLVALSAAGSAVGHAAGIERRNGALQAGALVAGLGGGALALKGFLGQAPTKTELGIKMLTEQGKNIEQIVSKSKLFQGVGLGVAALGAVTFVAAQGYANHAPTAHKA